MFEIVQNFEQMANRFMPSVMIVSGVVFLLLGLCIWLGGLTLRKILIFFSGLVGGFVVGLFVVGRNLFSASLTGVLSALSALILEKLLVILLAAILASAVAFTIAAEPYFEQAEVTEVQNDISEQTITVEFNDVIYELKKFGLDAGGKIKKAGTKIPINIWAIIAAPAVIVFVFGVVLWRFTSALFFSFTGTIIASFGILLILIYKGAEPAVYIHGKPLIFSAILVVIVALGTTIQLLFCKTKKQKITVIKPGRKNAGDNKEPEKIVEHDWRSA